MENEIPECFLMWVFDILENGRNFGSFLSLNQSNYEPKYVVFALKEGKICL